MFGSKTEIIKRFEYMINRVGIDIKECLEKYNQEQILGDLSFFKAKEKNFEKNFRQRVPFELELFNNSSERTNLYSESTKVVDYLNQIRMRTIDELRKAQEDTLDEYTRYKTSNNQQNDELKSQTFSPDKFYFQLLFLLPNEANWIFNLFTFVTDFHLPPIYINILDKSINDGECNYELLPRNPQFIFDENMVLVGLIKKYFFENLQTEKYPSHMIRVCKQDALNIKHIKVLYTINGVILTDSSSIHLSNLQTLDISPLRGSLEMVNIEGLSSLQTLHLSNFSPEKTSLKRLNSLRELSLLYPNSSNLEQLSNPFEYLPNIERLSISSELSYINLDSLVNLKSLRLVNTKSKLNVELFKNISNQLDEIIISNPIRHETIEKLFDGHIFSNLLILKIYMSCIDKFENRLFAGFPMLQTLNLTMNFIRLIYNDAFSNMKQLISLNLSKNFIESISKSAFSDLISLKSLNLNSNYIERIEENVFSSLNNLQSLDLSCNRLASLNPKSFAGLANLKSLDLSSNKLSYFDLNILDYIREIETINLSENTIANKEEILNRFNGSRINFIF